MLDIHEKYTTDERLDEMHHGWSTQRVDEPEHRQVCSKGARLLSSTGLLHRRIMAAVGTNTGGMHYFSTVLKKIGCCPPPAEQDLFFDTRYH
jgi:hypothetical protein